MCLYKLNRPTIVYTCSFLSNLADIKATPRSKNTKLHYYYLTDKKAVAMAHPEHTAHVVECAYKLRYFGDRLQWRYKLLEMLLHYKNITKY
ncbi:unnamed protein product [Boreogadus saida]